MSRGGIALGHPNSPNAFGESFSSYSDRTLYLYIFVPTSKFGNVNATSPQSTGRNLKAVLLITFMQRPIAYLQFNMVS